MTRVLAQASAVVAVALAAFPSTVWSESGIASSYPHSYQGRRTANGYDPLAPVRNRKLFAIYGEVESETRRLLATLSSSDQEAVVRFFETLHAARADGKT